MLMGLWTVGGLNSCPRDLGDLGRTMHRP